MAIVLSHGDCIKLSVNHYKCDASFAGIPILTGFSMEWHDPLDPVLKALDNLVGSLGPLKPIFDILALVVQIVKCVQAIPESILTLNPTELINCIPKLVELIIAVLSHIPPLSLFKLVAGAVCMIIAILEGIIATLELLKEAIEEIGVAFSQNLDLKDANLGVMIACGQANLLGSLDGMSGLFDLIAVAVAAINLFLELAQQEPIELPTSLGVGGGASLDASFLDPIIATLQGIVDALNIALKIIPTGISMAGA